MAKTYTILLNELSKNRSKSSNIADRIIQHLDKVQVEFEKFKKESAGNSPDIKKFEKSLNDLIEQSLLL